MHILVAEDARQLRLTLDRKAGTKKNVTIDDLVNTKQVIWKFIDTDIASIDFNGK